MYRTFLALGTPLLLVLGLVLGLGACGKKADRDEARLPAACAKAQAHGPLTWIEDDLAAALACGKARDLPVVVDLWAPWCHTCLSMKTTVLVDPAFAAHADRFVFAALDTDRAENAAAVAKLPLSAWPTFYVLGPDESVLARFVGAATVEQFRAFLDAGAQARAVVDGAARHLLAAERAIATQDLATAETELTAALEAAPPGWVRVPDVLGSLIHTRRKRGDDDGCLALAEQRLDHTGMAASATDFAGIALGCADALAAEHGARVAAFRERAIGRLTEIVDHPGAALSIDDRSDAMVYLREALATVGRKPEAINVAERQRKLLDEAAAKAATPTQAMTYNWQLAEVYTYLGRPLEAVPALEKCALALPKQYDPPARLGWVMLQAGKLDEAAAWTDKALALVYGPRKARLLGQRAEIAAKQGDAAAEKALRTQVVALWESLPPGQRNEDALARARQAVADLEAPPAPIAAP